MRRKKAIVTRIKTYTTSIILRGEVTPKTNLISLASTDHHVRAPCRLTYVA